ncbi:MAG: LbtU family siderophore porin [Desulfobulbus sp.]|nr:LbtU family siderophore porin [Desulfobulbus sp.]
MSRLLLAAILALFLFPDLGAAENRTTALRQPQPADPTAKAAGQQYDAPAALSSSPDEGIVTQPLNIDGGSFTPLFGNPFRTAVGIWSLPEDKDLTSMAMEPAFGTDPYPSPSGPRTPDSGGTKSTNSHAGDTPWAYRYAMDSKTSLRAGMTWIHNLGDAAGMMPSLDGPRSDGSTANELPGMNLNLGASYKALALTGGYIRALDSHASADRSMADVGNDPVAWNSELTYSTALLNREATLAVGYQRASDALHAYLPEERYRTRASMVLFGSTILSLEYYLDRNDSATNGEPDGYGIATKIGFGF